MTRIKRCLPGFALLLAVALGGGDPRAARAQQCDGGAPVSIIVLASPERVQQYAATLRGVRILRRDAQTVVFADGRVVTANLGAASAHLNAVGWATRRIEIVASFPKRSARRASPG